MIRCLVLLTTLACASPVYPNPCKPLAWLDLASRKVPDAPELVRKGLRGHSKPASRFVFDRDGRPIAYSGGEDRTVARWNLVTGRREWELNVGDEVTALAQTSDANVLVVGTEHGKIFVISANDGQVIKELDVPKSDVPVIRGDPLSQPVVAFAFTGDPRVILASTMHGQILQWDLENGRIARTLNGVPVINMEFAGGRLLLNSGRKLEIIDIRSQEKILDLPSKYGSISTAQMSDDGRLLAVGLANEVQVFDLENRRFMYQLESKATYIQKIVMKGNTILAFGRNSTVWQSEGYVIAWQDGKKLFEHTIPGWMEEPFGYLYNPPIAIDPTMQFLISGDGKNNAVKLWKLPQI